MMMMANVIALLPVFWRHVVRVLYGPRKKSRSRVRSANDCYRGGYALYMPQIGADSLMDKYRVYVGNTGMEAGTI